MNFSEYIRATATYYAAKFDRDEGAVATEYGFLIVFIAIAVSIGAVVLGQALLDLFNDTGTTVGTTSPGTVPVPPGGPSGS